MIYWLGAGIGLIALAIASPYIIAWAIAYISLHPIRKRFKGSPANFGAKYQPVNFHAEDGVNLSGWLVPRESARGVVILVHGMLGNRADMLAWASWLWEAGYAILTFDLRACGKSGGDRCMLGFGESKDVHAAVDFVSTHTETQSLPIGVLGFSMGAVAALRASALHEQVSCVVAHSPYLDIDSCVLNRCKKHYLPFAPRMSRLVRRIGLQWVDFDPDEVDLRRSMPALDPKRALLIAGHLDKLCPHEQIRHMHDLSCGASELLEFPDLGHKYPAAHQAATYRSTVLSFLQRQLIKKADIRPSEA